MRETAALASSPDVNPERALRGNPTGVASSTTAPRHVQPSKLRAQGRAKRRARTVLIADDDIPLAEVMAEVLQLEGYDVVSVSDSLRIYDSVKAHHPNLILLDISMPYLSGADQLQLFKLDPLLSSIPIIVVTGNPDSFEGIQRPEDLGVVDHLYKPFEAQELLSKVENALSKKNFRAS